MRRVYLDYAATTPVAPEVFAAMKPYFEKEYGNPGSLHSFGQEALAAVDGAREKVAQAIKADFQEVAFTGSATEANNLALRGAVRGRQRPKVIVSAIEHESILETARDLEKDGIEINVIPVDKRGIIDVKELESALDERTVLVSVMYVNNEIGSVQPIAAIAKMIEDSKFHPLFHTDASQAPVYFDCDVEKLGVDLMTLSSQKVYGPKGVGALYVKKSQTAHYPLRPVITGGGQEFGLRSGTENVPGVVGFGKAMESAIRNKKQAARRVAALKEYFWQKLKKIVPDVEINGSSGAPHILNVHFPSEYAGDLLVQMDLAGIAVSSGSACAARAFTPSHVLQALGFSGERIRGSIRFSFGLPTTERELNEVIKRMRGVL